ncbi:kinase domain protein, partial [Ichthyophthirius multifiliis]
MGICIQNSQYYMITEYLNEGSLFDHLHCLNTDFSQTQIIRILEDIALGMRYLHGIKVMHCDLKSSNVLIDENWNVKLCDFGLSRIKSKLNKQKKQQKETFLIGTPQWMAPEVMRREPYQEHSDVYSFGMILWEMINKQIPYKGMSHQQIYGTVGFDDNYEIQIPKKGIPRYLKLMKQCLNRKPEDRPSFKKIVQEIQETKQQEIQDFEK